MPKVQPKQETTDLVWEKVISDLWEVAAGFGYVRDGNSDQAVHEVTGQKINIGYGCNAVRIRFFGHGNFDISQVRHIQLADDMLLKYAGEA